MIRTLGVVMAVLALGATAQAQVVTRQTTAPREAVPQDQTASAVVAANTGWTPTGLTVRAGARLQISAQGQWTLAPSTLRAAQISPAGPDGYPRRTSDAAPIPSANLGALIGRIGDGAPFVVGSAYAGDAKDAGPLFLAINDDPKLLQDNAGRVAASVRMTPPPPPTRTQPTEPARPGFTIPPDLIERLLKGRPQEPARPQPDRPAEPPKPETPATATPPTATPPATQPPVEGAPAEPPPAVNAVPVEPLDTTPTTPADVEAAQPVEPLPPVEEGVTPVTPVAPAGSPSGWPAGWIVPALVAAAVVLGVGLLVNAVRGRRSSAPENEARVQAPRITARVVGDGSAGQTLRVNWGR